MVFILISEINHRLTRRTEKFCVHSFSFHHPMYEKDVKTKEPMYTGYMNKPTGLHNHQPKMPKTGPAHLCPPWPYPTQPTGPWRPALAVTKHQSDPALHILHTPRDIH